MTNFNFQTKFPLKTPAVIYHHILIVMLDFSTNT